MNKDQRTNIIAFTTIVLAALALSLALAWSRGHDLYPAPYSCDRWLASAPTAADSLAIVQDATLCPSNESNVKSDVR